MPAPAQRDKKKLSADAVAGTTTALVAIPDGMAQALIAGVNPIYGLYSGMVNTIVGSATTSTSLMIVSLTNALALVAGSTLAGLKGGARIEALFALTLAVGLIQLALGALKLGGIIRFISDSVMTGFITAAAALIILSQLKNLTGIKPDGEGAAPQALDILGKISSADARTVIVGVVTIFLIVTLKRSRLRKFADIITVVLGAIFVAAIGWESIATVGDIGPISFRLPSFTVPNVTLIPDLAGGAVALAILGLTQSAGISSAFPNPDGRRSNMSRDFSSQGAANIAGSFFQTMPSGGSLSATGVSVVGGAKSRWAGVFAGLLLALLVLVAGRAATLVPLTTLAGLLIVTGANVVASQWPNIMQTWRVSKLSSLAMGLTFSLAILVSLQVAIYAGVALSLVLHSYTAATNIKVVELVAVDGAIEEHSVEHAKLRSNAVTALSVRGNFYFASVYTLEELLPSSEETHRAVVVLRLRGRGSISNTYLNWLRRYAKKLEESGGKLILAGVDQHVLEQMQRSGFIDSIGPKNIFGATNVLHESLSLAVEAAKQWLQTTEDDR